jgi:hypothetical protein
MAGGGDLGFYIGSYTTDADATSFLTDRGYSQCRGYIYWNSAESALKVWNGAGWVSLVQNIFDGVSVKSYTGVVQQAAGTYYVAGFYEAADADANLNQGALSQAYGTANIAYGAHAFIVAGGAGTVDTGTVAIRVTGTSVDDQGNRTASDTEDIVADITTLSLNQYVETTKKWIGQVTFSLVETVGDPTTYSVDFNYGFAKYEDMWNRDFQVQFFEAVGNAGANDSSFDLEFLLHDGTGWTYAATGFAPGGTVIASLGTDYSTEHEIASGEYFAWKRDNLATNIEGSADEGFVIRITAGANNSVEYVSCNVGVAAQ